MNKKLLAALRKMLGAVDIKDGKIVELDDEAFESLVETALKGTKLVDLTDGEYVAKEKFDKEVETRKAAETARDNALKEVDGDEGLKRQLETVTKERNDALEKLGSTTGELTRAQREKLVAEKLAHVPAKLRRVALLDAEALVTDEVSFDDALAKVIADDEDYAEPEASTETKTTVKVKTGEHVGGSGEIADDAKAAVDAVFADAAPEAGKD